MAEPVEKTNIGKIREFIDTHIVEKVKDGVDLTNIVKKLRERREKRKNGDGTNP